MQQRRKEEQRKRFKSNPKAQKAKGGHKGGKATNYVPEPSPVTRSISQKKMEKNPKSLS